MQAKINRSNGRQINVTFTFDDGSKLTQDVSLTPYAVDTTDEEGKIIQVMIDPLEDVSGFLKGYANAYLQGKAVEEQEQDASVEANLIGTNITL